MGGGFAMVEKGETRSEGPAWATCLLIRVVHLLGGHGDPHHGHKPRVWPCVDEGDAFPGCGMHMTIEMSVMPAGAQLAQLPPLSPLQANPFFVPYKRK